MYMLDGIAALMDGVPALMDGIAVTSPLTVLGVHAQDTEFVWLVRNIQVSKPGLHSATLGVLDWM